MTIARRILDAETPKEFMGRHDAGSIHGWKWYGREHGRNKYQRHAFTQRLSIQRTPSEWTVKVADNDYFAVEWRTLQRFPLSLSWEKVKVRAKILADRHYREQAREAAKHPAVEEAETPKEFLKRKDVGGGYKWVKAGRGSHGRWIYRRLSHTQMFSIDKTEEGWQVNVQDPAYRYDVDWEEIDYLPLSLPWNKVLALALRAADAYYKKRDQGIAAGRLPRG